MAKKTTEEKVGQAEWLRMTGRAPQGTEVRREVSWGEKQRKHIAIALGHDHDDAVDDLLGVIAEGLVRLVEVLEEK